MIIILADVTVLDMLLTHVNNGLGLLMNNTDIHFTHQIYGSCTTNER